MQQGQNLIGTYEKRGAGTGVRHDDRPVVTGEKPEEAGDKIADGAFDSGIIDEVVGSPEPEDNAYELIARSIADPNPGRILVHAVV